MAGPFRVDPVRGYLTLTQPLDYESTQRYVVVVNAAEEDTGREKKLTGNLTIFIEVQDVNDNAPIFERPEYIVRIEESAAIDTKVCVIDMIHFSYYIFLIKMLWLCLYYSNCALILVL